MCSYKYSKKYYPPHIRSRFFNKIDHFYIQFPNNTYFFVTNEPNLNLQMQTFATF